MLPSSDTIAAIATGVGGGIGIVRISGPHAESIVALLVRPWPKRPPSHKLHYGKLYDPQLDEPVDEVLACVMRGPRSYTGEDVVEIHGHGGAQLLSQILELVLRAGARMAEAGEFTRRAFLAGRIDLTRAEAVAELIAARSERALAAAAALAQGALEREIRQLRSDLVRQLAELEGAIDFPDEKLDTNSDRGVATSLMEVGRRLEALAGTYRRFVFDRAEVVLVGRTNAGKSSLFNALSGDERALVDRSAGTTRDVLQVELNLSGTQLLLYDTAGERFETAASADASTASAVEARGLALGRKQRERADLVALVIDGTLGFSAAEQALWSSLAPSPRLLVWNKRDLAPAPRNLSEGNDLIETSAVTGQGIDELKHALRRKLDSEGEEGKLVVSRRHQEALLAAAEAIARAAKLLLVGEPSELAAVDAREALHHLGRITGETVDVDVLDAIFARFCIGK